MADEPRKPAMFRETPKSVKTLRQFYRDPTKLLDIARFTDELKGVNDRAIILLLATGLDDLIRYKIATSLRARKLSEDDFDIVFRFEGPLGTFSSRTEIAFLFGIISDEIYEQLDIVRELRNAAAHSMHSVAFSEQAVVNVAMRMFEPLGVVRKPSVAADDVRNAFLTECMFLYTTINLGSREKARDYVRQMVLALQSPSPDKSP